MLMQHYSSGSGKGIDYKLANGRCKENSTKASFTLPGLRSKVFVLLMKGFAGAASGILTFRNLFKIFHRCAPDQRSIYG